MGMAEDLATALSDGKCPVCASYYNRIIFKFEGGAAQGLNDVVEDDVVEQMCEMCWELRSTIPEEERPPIEVIEFRDNTRRPESERKEYFFYGRDHDLEDEERGRP